MLESTIENYLVKRVKEIGGVAEKFTSPARRSVPDRLVLIPAKPIAAYQFYAEAQVVFVELKAPGKKPTPAQARDHERRREMGFRVEVLDSKEAVDAFIQTL